MEAQNDDRLDDVQLSDVFTRAVRYWWLVTILVMAGGVVGLFVSRLQRPLYESTAQITTVIDYAYAGRLTDYEEDHLLAAIGDIITSDAVMRSTAAAAVQEGLTSSPEETMAGLSASRQGYRWELSSRFNDPHTSQRVNQLWLDASMKALEGFRRDSITALAQVNAQAEVEACFQQAASLEPVSPYCSLGEMRELLASLEGSSESEQPGSLLTGLLVSRISYQVTREAVMPTKPVHYSVNLTTLAGAIIGLLAVMILFILGYPRSQATGKLK